MKKINLRSHKKRINNVLKVINYTFFIFIIILVAFSIGMIISKYKEVFNGKLSYKYEDWYVFAYLLAPLTSLVSIIILLWTLNNQKNSFQNQLSQQKRADEFKVVNNILQKYKEDVSELKKEMEMVDDKENKIRIRMETIIYFLDIDLDKWTRYHYYFVYINFMRNLKRLPFYDDNQIDKLLEKYKNEISRFYTEEKENIREYCEEFLPKGKIHHLPDFVFNKIELNVIEINYIFIGEVFAKNYKEYSKILIYLEILDNFENDNYKNIFYHSLDEIDLKFFFYLFLYDLDCDVLVKHSKIWELETELNYGYMNIKFNKMLDLMNHYHNRKRIEYNIVGPKIEQLSKDKMDYLNSTPD